MADGNKKTVTVYLPTDLLDKVDAARKTAVGEVTFSSMVEIALVQLLEREHQKVK